MLPTHLDVTGQAEPAVLVAHDQMIRTGISDVVAGYAGNHPVHDFNPRGLHRAGGSVFANFTRRGIAFQQRMRRAEITLDRTVGYVVGQ